MEPHPEGGSYRETWRGEPLRSGERGIATAILFLLARDEISARHRIDAAELWLWHAGASLEMSIASRSVRLGPALDSSEQVQALVPAHAWQSARSTGDWTLVSCVVAPAFSFDGFELATAE